MNFFSIYIKLVSAFLFYTASVILVIAIVFRQSNSFWHCANGFVNIFSVHNDATSNFIRCLIFTYSFVRVNVDVSYDGNRNLSELINK